MRTQERFEARRIAHAILRSVVSALSALAILQPIAQAQTADRNPVRVDLHGDRVDTGAAVRLGTVRYRVPGRGTRGLEFAANDRTLITGGDGRHLTLIDAPTGRHITTIDTEGQYITAMQLAADRRTVFTLGHEFDEAAAANFYSLKQWSILTGERVSTLRFDAREDYHALVISPDGQTAIVASRNRPLRFFDIASGKESLSRPFDPRVDGQIAALALSPDGRLLVIGTNRKRLFWNWKEERDPTSIDSDRTDIASLAISPDGTLLAEGPDTGQHVILRDIRTREVRFRLAEPDGNPMLATSLAFSADGTTLVGTNAVRFSDRRIEKRIHLWDTATGRLRRSFSTGNDSTVSVALSRNGRWLAATHGDSLVKVWDLSTGASLDESKPGHTGGITAIRFSPDGRSVLTASDDGTARVWDAASGAMRHVVPHGHCVRAASLSPDGRLLATSSLDNTVRLLETETGNEVHRLTGHGNLGGRRAVEFAADGRTFASWGDDLSLRVWDVRTGKAIEERRVYPAAMEKAANAGVAQARGAGGFGGVRIDFAQFSPDGRRLFLSPRGSISVFDVATGKTIAELPHPDGLITGLASSPDGAILATSAWGRGRETVLADGGVRFSASGDQMVRVREVATDRELFQIPLPDDASGPVLFSPDGAFLAVAQRKTGGRLAIHDARSGQELWHVEGLHAPPRTLAVSADNRRLACGFEDGTTLIWDLPPLAAP